MANLFPTTPVNVSPLVNRTKDTVVGYKRGIKFDDELGDFVRDGQHKLVVASGVEEWQQWCLNCISTERYSLASYSTDFAINTRLVFALPDNASRENLLQKEITDALMADDYKRTQSVTDFEFNWFAPDAVEVSMVVTGIEGAQIDLTTQIRKGG